MARVLGIAALAACLVGSNKRPSHGTLTVVFLAVSWGDATLYRGPCGEVGLVDASYTIDNKDLILATLDGFGRQNLRWIALSHYDQDHLANAQTIAGAPGVHLDAIYDRGGGLDTKTSQLYRNYATEASTASIRMARDIGQTFSLCTGPQTVLFTVESAGTDGTARSGVRVSDENDRGLCLKVTYLDFDVASCGDASSKVEDEVAEFMGNVEVAKIDHHGSKGSSSPKYVNTLKAQVAAVMGPRAQNGHPDAAVLRLWQDSNAMVYQPTYPDGPIKDGDVTITTSGRTDFFVVTSGAAGIVAPPSTYPIGIPSDPNPTPTAGRTEAAPSTPPGSRREFCMDGTGQSTEGGIVHLPPMASYAIAAAILALLTFLLHSFAKWTTRGEERDKRRGLLSIIVGVDNRVSTSKVQVVMWTYAVAFVLLAIVLQGRVDDVVGGGIETQYLFLLGIPVVGATGAALITATKVKDGSEDKPEASSEAAPNAVTGIRNGLADIVTDDSGRGDLGDFQYFVFNLVALTYFFTAFFSATPDILPTIPDTLVALTGVSAFAYLSKKGVVTKDPKLTGVYPSSARPGERVTIRGVNLVGRSAALHARVPSKGLIVLFGGRLGANVEVNDEGIVTATVPIDVVVPESGTSDVRVVTAAGVETPSLPFTVITPNQDGGQR